MTAPVTGEDNPVLDGQSAAPANLFDLSGKVAVVTGGSRGIGRMIAFALASAGARVVIASRDADALAATAKDVSTVGECSAIPADLATTDGARAFADTVLDLEPEVDVLVNNAGAAWGAPIGEFPESGWDRVMNINLKGVFQTTQFLLPALRAAGTAAVPARIVNIGSSDGLTVPLFENYPYSASKAAIHHLTRHMAATLAPDILVNAIAPGPFETKMMKGPLRERGDDIVGETLLGRIGAPDDIAGAVIFMASSASRFVTGIVLPVDGGISAA